MAKEHVVFISCAWEWEAGDAVIHQGLRMLLPELAKFDIHHSAYYLVNHDQTKNDPAKLEELIRTARYIITPGTPSWVNEVHRVAWKMCIKHKKKVAFLGIGLAVPYEGDFWYGREALVGLKNARLVDTVVCRDRLCYYWVHQRAGIAPGKAIVLPCPAFYMFPQKRVTSKKKVVFAIADVEEVSHASDETFKEYYNKTVWTVNELRTAGAEVSIAYHRWRDDNSPFYKKFKELFPKDELHRFRTPESYVNFHKDKDVYIGVRNHGALPCAGSGMPSLLLGTDCRQYLADEIPFIAKLDISFCDWEPTFVMDWYRSLEPSGTSQSLLTWRNLTYNHWRQWLAPQIEVLK
jgi:hypothetical protein